MGRITGKQETSEPAMGVIKGNSSTAPRADATVLLAVNINVDGKHRGASLPAFAAPAVLPATNQTAPFACAAADSVRRHVQEATYSSVSDCLCMCVHGPDCALEMRCIINILCGCVIRPAIAEQHGPGWAVHGVVPLICAVRCLVALY